MKFGVRTNENGSEPSLSIVLHGWKGTRLGRDNEKEKTKLFIYDLVKKYKNLKQDITLFEQITEMKFMLDPNTLLLSAVRKGQSDIFIYKIDKDDFEYITNDAAHLLGHLRLHSRIKPVLSFPLTAPTRPVKEVTPQFQEISSIYSLQIISINRHFWQLTQLTNMRYGS